MNFQQLEYIIAVDQHRHFLKAAEACNVTQATLSMMIKKLEEELGVVIFDRSKQPVIPTEVGILVLNQARKILQESEQMTQLVQLEKGEIAGELRVGIIPTVAPYLLPLFIKKFTNKYPKVVLKVTELTTEDLVLKLKSSQIDIGILATPLKEKSIKEFPLYYEQYMLYIGPGEKGFKKEYVLPKDIDVSRLLLLEEGHCMRNQVLNLCELKKQSQISSGLMYEAGSIDTLINLVDTDFGMTVIPEFVVEKLTKSQKKQLRYFKDPVPVREISMVMNYEHVKARLVRALRDTIIKCIPSTEQRMEKMRILNLE